MTGYKSVTERNKKNYLIPSEKEDFGLGVSGSELTTDLEGKPYEEEKSLFDGIGDTVGGLWDAGSNFLTKAFGGDSSSSSKSSGFNMSDAGNLAKGIGSLWDAYASSEYKKEIVGMEKERVAREVDKQKKAQSAFDSVWA